MGEILYTHTKLHRVEGMSSILACVRQHKNDLRVWQNHDAFLPELNETLDYKKSVGIPKYIELEYRVLDKMKTQSMPITSTVYSVCGGAHIHEERIEAYFSIDSWYTVWRK